VELNAPSYYWQVASLSGTTYLIHDYLNFWWKIDSSNLLTANLTRVEVGPKVCSWKESASKGLFSCPEAQGNDDLTPTDISGACSQCFLRNICSMAVFNPSIDQISS